MTEEQIRELEGVMLGGYYSTLDRFEKYIEEIKTLQQQQKQLIDKLKWIKLHSNERHIVQRAVAALQQIQGKDEGE